MENGQKYNENIEGFPNSSENTQKYDYSAIFNAANDAIFVHDIETYRIIDVNQKACEMYCYQKEEMLRARLSDLSADVGFYTEESAFKFLEMASKGEPQLFEWMAKDKIGRVFWVEVNLKRAVVAGKYNLLAVVRDITERKQTEERLNRINEVFLSFGNDSKENIRQLTSLCGELLGADCALYNRLDNGMLYSCGTWNIPNDFNPSDKADGHICYDVIKQGSGDIVVINNLQGTDYARTDPNVAKYGLQTYVGCAVKFGGIYVGTLCAIYKYDFSPNDEDKKIMSILASAIGVEEERGIDEKLLKEGRDKIQTYLDIAGVAIVAIDKDQKVSLINKKGCDMLGYSYDEIIGKNWFDNFIPERERADVKHIFNELMAGKIEATERAENKILLKNSQERTISWHNALVKNNKGEIIGTLSSGEDITDRKKAEEDIIRRDYQLEILSRTSQHINTVLDLPVITRTLVAAAMELVNAGGGAAGLLLGGKIVFKEYNRDGRIEQVDYVFEFGKNVFGSVYNTKRPYISNEASKDPLIIPEKKKAFNIQSFVSVPIININGDFIGCVEIYNKKDGQVFDAQDVFMLQGLAASASIAIENANMILERKKSEESLKKSERFLSNVFDSIQDGLSVLDKEMNIVRVNPVMEKWYAHAMPLVGKKCYEAYHGRSSRCEVCPTKKSLESGKSGHEIVTKTGPGGKVVGWMDLYSFPLFDAITGQLTGVIEYVRDITERKLAEKEKELLSAEIIESNKRLKQLALRDSQTGLYNYRYLNEIIESEFYRARRYAHPLSVIMIDIDYFKSINEVYGHDFGDLVLKQLAIQLKRMVRRYDIVVRSGGEEFIILSPGVDKTKAVALAQRILDAVSLYSFGDKKRNVKLKLSMSVASYPYDKASKGMDLINTADKIIDKVKEAGGNKAYSSAEASVSKKKIMTAKDDIAEIKYLKNKIERLTKRGKQNLIESIFAFAKTIEMRDHYTGEHVENTVRYSTEIARALKLSPEETENIRQASVLHDLGKIGISDRILLKRSKLTKKEFEEIKRHPQIAADIIRPIQFMHDIVPLVLYHHERWDGKGYPSGLRGEEIPIGARIIAIADVYQALTSNRPYRKAFSKKDALDIIRKGSGTQFDPRIVKVFLKVIKKEK